MSDTSLPKLILAPNGRAFRDRDAADAKCGVMRSELAGAFDVSVVSHGNGFAVELRESTFTGDDSTSGYNAQAERYSAPPSPLAELLGVSTSVPGKQRSDRSSENPSKDSREANSANKRGDTQKAASEFPDAFTLNPAFRAFPFKLLSAALGLLFMVAPGKLFEIVHMSLPSDPDTAGALVTAVSVLSLLVVLYSMLQMMWAYLSNAYVVGEAGVEQVKWYFKGVIPRRGTTRIQYNLLRTVDVDQSLLQTLLGVGHVRLASGGTDTYEVELKHVTQPRKLQTEIIRRMHAVGVNAQPLRAIEGGRIPVATDPTNS